MPNLRQRQIICEYQKYTEHPPMQPKQLYAQACSGDGPTVDRWRPTWIGNMKANKEKFGSFAENSVGQLFDKFKHQSCVVAGSGPSLQYNAHLLKDSDIPVISCLHNFHFMEDNEIPVKFYVTLDAGDVTVEEVYEGGSKTPDEYWEMTKDRTLVAYVGTSPKLLDKWQGKVLFFQSPVPDLEIEKEMAEIEGFGNYFSTGGNVLGACLYLARGVLGCNPVAFIGADFCFGYDHKFHAWDSKYDKELGYVIDSVDIFGNRVKTWQSYDNFKRFFEWVSLQVPGIYVNCTEGGTFGAYRDGNLMSILQMDLQHFINMHSATGHVKEVFCDPERNVKRILY